SSHSDHGRKNSSNRKHLHRSNDDEVSYNNTYKTITEITSETYEKYMTHLILTHTQYAGYGTTMFPAGVYHMSYGPTSFYSIEYDHCGIPIAMQSEDYGIAMNMYSSQPTSSMSSRSQKSN
ncbi:unnamed protein product, partial [Rotaria sp. Silwood1]